MDSRAPTPGLSSLGRSASLALTLDTVRVRTSRLCSSSGARPGAQRALLLPKHSERAHGCPGRWSWGVAGLGRAFQACAPDPWGTPHAKTEFVGFLLQKLKNHLPGGGEEEQIRSMGLTYRNDHT